MNIRLVWLVISASLCLISCSDYESVPYEAEPEVESFNGTILEYLSGGDERLNLRFDSMLLLIDNIPGFKQLLEKENTAHTVFAIPNNCFQASFSQLNVYREGKKLGREIFFEDMLIAPFTVLDTTITVISAEKNDTVITEYNYDYRKDLEEMLCKYIFEGDYNTENILYDEGNITVSALKYDYLMNIECFRQPASGLSGKGTKTLLFSDMRNSRTKDNWLRSSTVWNDVYTRNGLIHILSPQHNFGFDEFIKKFHNYGNEYEQKK
ncbi:MAG: hypothetical protein LBU22_14570 [Dysgonamonadaceae bacterium]|nr:hypothetical protein [Dysgonamonadaceae bacterium]